MFLIPSAKIRSKESVRPQWWKKAAHFRESIPGGGVYSFFRYGNEDLAILPVLDDLIDEGWELYWDDLESSMSMYIHANIGINKPNARVDGLSIVTL